MIGFIISIFVNDCQPLLQLPLWPPLTRPSLWSLLVTHGSDHRQPPPTATIWLPLIILLSTFNFTITDCHHDHHSDQHQTLLSHCRLPLRLASTSTFTPSTATLTTVDHYTIQLWSLIWWSSTTTLTTTTTHFDNGQPLIWPSSINTITTTLTTIDHHHLPLL